MIRAIINDIRRLNAYEEIAAFGAIFLFSCAVLVVGAAIQ